MEQLKLEESQIISQTKGKLNIINKNLIEDSKKNIIVMGRNTQLSIEDENGRNLRFIKLIMVQNCFSKTEKQLKKVKKSLNGILIHYLYIVKQVVLQIMWILWKEAL